DRRRCALRHLRGRRADPHRGARPRKPRPHHRRAAAARREDPDGARADAFAAPAQHLRALARDARRAAGGRRHAAPPLVHATLPLLARHGFPALRRKRLETLQVNLGYRCNQSCVHCHVNAGPQRTEMMPPEVIDDVIAFLPQVETLDITGGAPELHPQFRSLVSRARGLGKHVIDRCNLTILQEPGQADLARFLAAARVEIIASLPCYTPELVDRQRGSGVYQRSIAALRELNALGYGDELVLNLV